VKRKEDMMKVITFMLLACALATTAHAQETKLRGFSVVLLLGEQTGSIPTQGLSAPAQRALADIKEFLPYKGFKVLDTQWVAGSDGGSSKGRVRSHDNYILDFQVETWSAGARFRLGSGSNPLLDNTFRIKPGETVVVGTSRVASRVAPGPENDTALIVLLTAVSAEK
jgi:hypothetical protein